MGTRTKKISIWCSDHGSTKLDATEKSIKITKKAGTIIFN